MLSICIPVYNYDVTALVSSLHLQGINLNIPFEILLVDDASDDSYREKNQELNKLEQVNYIQLDKNIGRAKIRNFLADSAQYHNLVFMDCDSAVPNDKYLERYLDYCKAKAVVCGGRTHHPTPGGKAFKLRWLYGTRREEKTASQRAEKPNNSFMTNNFLISKDIFIKFKLNESIKGYGHEDTFFGYQLKKANTEITHIDNPLIHTGLETSEVFLQKTKEAINNLLGIYKTVNYDNKFAEMVSLLNAYRKISNWKLVFFFRWFYNLYHRPMENNLLGSNPKLWIFDLYKLGYLCKIVPNIHND